MPVLLCPSKAASRALAWRGGTTAGYRALTPLAAVRHLFRDHSSGSHHDSNGGQNHGSQNQRHHQLHHRYPNISQASGLASDWPTLYLGAKLALWSGLCYFPYETIPRTLQEEGLKMVAYGRTSYTCWYVADGCVDFDALPRRAFPRDSLGASGASPGSEADGEVESQIVSDTQTSSFYNDVKGDGDKGHLLDRSGHVHIEAAASANDPAPATGPLVDQGNNMQLLQQLQQGQEYVSGGDSASHCLGPSLDGFSSKGLASGGQSQPQSGHGGHRHAHTNNSSTSPGNVHSQDSHVPSTSKNAHGTHALGSSHTLRNGHIHLHRESSPALHLKVHGPAARLPTSNGGGAHPAAVKPAMHSDATTAATRGTRCRFIFLRGVQWAAHDTNTFSLSASLASFWPAPLIPLDAAGGRPEAAAGSSTAGSSSSSSSGSSLPTTYLTLSTSASSEYLVAHSGVAAMARELLPVLLTHIREAAAEGIDHVVFAGHSLGGSLAKLLWAMSIMHGHRSPEATSCHTFGSPPVLAHAAGGGGTRVLRLLSAPPGATVNWVLEHDPVPRAMLMADPYFSAARRALPGLSALLALRGAVLGEGATLSSGRFLYETVGELLLLRWSSRGGCEVVPVSEMEAESLLQMALDEAVTAPVRSLQYWLDHHHASYHHDLDTAALVAYRRFVRSQGGTRGHQEHHARHNRHQQNHHHHHHQQELVQLDMENSSGASAS